MGTLADRVAQRYLLADSYGDPADLLKQYQTAVGDYAAHEKMAKEWLVAYADILRLYQQGPSTREEIDQIREKYMIDEVRKDAKGRITSYRSRTGPIETAVGYNGRSGAIGRIARKLVFAILQQLALPPKLRKAVEVSARWWDKKVHFPKGDTFEAREALKVEMYLEHLLAFQRYGELYAEVIRAGKLHSAEGEGATQISAGPFRVVNTGGYDADVIAHCAKVAVEVAHRMGAIGLSKVCYGDLLVSRNLMAQKNVGAFYNEGPDEMFLRPFPGSAEIAVRVTCHELTHRLVAKHLRGKKYEIEQLYETCKSSNQWVTPYARKGGPEENFCEMVSFWAMGQLAQAQQELLSQIVS